MKASELRNKSVAELKDELVALMRELFNLRTQRIVGQSTTTHHFKIVKKGIARINTVISEKEGSLL